tara:strand:- start:23104 stop:24828 length:1725 start_codon:yes stop_codon:yes gene_type:complete
MEILIQYGDDQDDLLKFSSKFGYPTPTVNMDTQYIRTSAGDSLSTETSVTLKGLVYTQKQADHDTTTNIFNLPASPGPKKNFDNVEYKDFTVAGLFGAASGLQEAVLNRNHEKLVIKTADNTAILTNGHASVDSINFSPTSNNWNQTVDYEIVFKIYGAPDNSHLINDYNDVGNKQKQAASENTGTYVTSCTDSYKLELMDDNKYFFGGDYTPTYKLTRTLGAVGRVIQQASGAIYHAQQWVGRRERIAPLTGMFRPESFTLYNQERSIDLDESAGSYTITDNFIAKSGLPYLHTSEVEISSDVKLNNKFTVKGTIQGLEPATGIYGMPATEQNEKPINPFGKNQIYPTSPTLYDQSTGRIDNDKIIHPKKDYDSANGGLPMTAYHNAVIGYKNADGYIFGQALAYNSIAQVAIADSTFYQNEYPNFKSRNINPVPLSSVEAAYPYEGKITYTREYDCRNVPILSGALTESLKINTNFPTIRNKEIKILGRRLGPLVYEYYNSLEPGSITVTYEGTFPRPGGLKKYSFPQGILNDLNQFLLQYQPPYSYLTENKESLSLKENKITRVMTWTHNT